MPTLTDQRAMAVLCLRLLGRLLELAWLYLPLLLPLAAGMLTDLVIGLARRTCGKRMPARLVKAEGWRAYWWTLALRNIQRSGPVFVKLGQWVSTRPDLVPEEWCTALRLLQDSTEPHALPHTHLTLDNAFPSEPWYQKLLIEPEPIGSGCIAQVYVGRLVTETWRSANTTPTCKPTVLPIASAVVGLFKCSSKSRREPRPTKPECTKTYTKVAVKVVHPQVSRCMELDMRFLEIIAVVADKLGMEGLGVSFACRQFKAFIETQADLRLEAANLQRLRGLLVGSRSVVVPRVFPEWSAQDVLVMSFEEGEPLSTLLADEPAAAANAASRGDAPRGAGPRDAPRDALRKEVWGILIDAVWACVFRHRLVHGDLHPGNLLWRRGGASGAVELVMLDCGLAIDLRGDAGEDLSRVVRALLKAMRTSTEDEVGHLLIELSKRVGGRPEDVWDADGFARGQGQLIREAKACGFKLGRLNAGSMMGRSLLLGRRHRVRFDARFVNLGVAIMILQGVALRLDAEGDLLGRMMPHVLTAAVTG